MPNAKNKHRGFWGQNLWANIAECLLVVAAIAVTARPVPAIAGETGESPGWCWPESGCTGASQVAGSGDSLDDARRPRRRGRMGVLGAGRGRRTSNSLRHRRRPETVIQNARELKIDLSDVTEVILSHHHGDHVGGLLTLRRELAKQKPDALKRAYVGAGIFLSRPGPEGRETNEALSLKKEYEDLGGSFVVIDRPTELFPGAWLTGPVPRTHPERNWSLKRMVRKDTGELVEDNLPEDMSMVLDTDKGLVLISGCGHAGIVNTLEYARQKVRETRVHAALGGFHLFEADKATLDWTADKLRTMELGNFLGAHCTGIESVFGLRQRLDLSRTACSVGAVGARFGLKSGLDPGAIAK